MYCKPRDVARPAARDALLAPGRSRFKRWLPGPEAECVAVRPSVWFLMLILAAALAPRSLGSAEHARQFDAGEFSFVRDLQSGEWRADVVTYDIGDEVRAWSAQLALAESRDFWDSVGGSTRPTLLSQFSLARTMDEQSDLLAKGPYRRVNRRVGCDVVFLAGTGLVPGQLVRTTGPRQVFGRVVKVV